MRCTHSRLRFLVVAATALSRSLVPLPSHFHRRRCTYPLVSLSPPAGLIASGHACYRCVHRTHTSTARVRYHLVGTAIACPTTLFFIFYEAISIVVFTVQCTLFRSSHPIAFALFAFWCLCCCFPSGDRCILRVLLPVYTSNECMSASGPQWCRFDDVHSSFGMIRDARMFVRECGLHDRHVA